MDVNEIIEKIKVLKCPQCGGVDLDLVDFTKAKCKHCGATIMIDQPKTEVTNNITVVSDGVNVDAQISYFNVKPDYTKKAFYKKSLEVLCKDVSTPVDIFDSKFSDVKEKRIKLVKYKAVAHISYTASLGYERKETYSEYDSFSKEYKQKTRTVIDYKPTSGESSGEVSFVVPSGEKLEIEEIMRQFEGKSSLFDIKDFSSLEGSYYNKGRSHYDLVSDLALEHAKNVVPTDAFEVNFSESGQEHAKKEMLSDLAFKVEDSLKVGKVAEVKGFSYSGHVDHFTSVECYSLPVYSLDYDYKEESYGATAIPVEAAGVVYSAPNETDDVVSIVTKKAFVPTILATLFMLASIVISMLVQNTAVCIVAVLLAVAMFITSVVVRKSSQKNVIKGRQGEKQAKLSERLSERGL